MNKSYQDSLQKRGYTLGNTMFTDEKDFFEFSLNFWESKFENHEKIIKVKENVDSQLIALSRQELWAHNECVYSSYSPEKIILWCKENSVKWGEFFLIDWSEVVKKIPNEVINLIKKYRYKFTDIDGKKRSRNMIISHPKDSSMDILFFSFIWEYAEKWLNNKKRHFDAPTNIQNIIKYTILEIIQDNSMKLIHSWSKWDFIIFDNYRFLHGRNWYGSLWNRELWHNRLI